MELRERALQVLCVPDPQRKAAQSRELWGAAASLPLAERAPCKPAELQLPGRPARPQLIHPSQVPRRSPFKPDGLAALLHAIAHIEFNAIKMAHDARISAMREDTRRRTEYACFRPFADLALSQLIAQKQPASHAEPRSDGPANYLDMWR
jgi:uncharacterized ferritin-like protein (DUF455 family)